MSLTNWGKHPSNIPLWIFGFLCLSTFVLTHLRVTIGKKTDSESSLSNQRNWTIWNFQQENGACGLFFKAVIMVSSPFLPITSTLVLLLGVTRKNTYLFLPWLVLTVKGLLTVQSLNLREMYEKLVTSSPVCDRWKYIFIYAGIVLFEMAACLYYHEVFRVFRRFWAIEPPLCGGNQPKDGECCGDEATLVDS